MVYIIAGCVLILLVMFDISRTTLTTKGEGLISSVVSGGFRKFAAQMILRGHRLSEVVGATSILTLGSVWLAGLWAGWVLVFLGIPDALGSSDRPVSGLYDAIYYVGFTLSTLGVGDITPQTTSAQMVTVLASFNGLLVITLIVTYALSVVSGVVARRVLAYKVYLVGEEEGDFLTQFSSVDDFIAWVADIKKELISCTEQRLAYPILDNFVSREEKYSLAVQLARLGLASQFIFQDESGSEQSKQDLNQLFSVLYRYTALTGITDDDLTVRLKKLGERG